MYYQHRIKWFRAVTDFFKDPMTTQTAIQGLTGLKKVDLQEGKIKGKFKQIH